MIVFLNFLRWNLSHEEEFRHDLLHFSLQSLQIECTLEVAMPEDGSQPHGVFNTDSIPEEWKQYKLPPAESAAAASTNPAEE